MIDNENTICENIPKYLFEKAIKKYKKINIDKPQNGLYYQNMVSSVAYMFGVSKETAKKCFHKFGHYYVEGTFVEVDGKSYPPFSFAKGSLKENENFVIDRKTYEKLIFEDIRFAKLINSGRYIYLGYVVCKLDSKYVNINIFENGIKFVLSAYAMEHIDECCIKFILSEINFPVKYKCYCMMESPYDYRYSDKECCYCTPEKLSSIIKDKINELKENDKQRIADKKIIFEMESKGIVTFSGALKYIMDVVKKPKIKKEAMAERIGCDAKTIQNYRNNTTPNTIEKVLLICLGCQIGEELSMYLIKKSIGGIPENKESVYKFLLKYTNESLDLWDSIMKEFNLPPLRFNR